MFCSDLHSALAPLLAGHTPDQIVVVYDRSVPQLTERTGLPMDQSLGMDISESVKTLDSVSRIWDFLFEQGITRRGLLIAVGGGVLTDIAGFAAATYKRGIDYINIPTSLLAMVDASSGGKTGINYRGLKNSIGVFAPPVETLIWPGWLTTLPSRDFLNGFAEMLKTGLVEISEYRVQNTDLWERLLGYDLEKMDIEALTPLIEACVRAKERIVAADPLEKGLRKVLNFGHTFGHALEEITVSGERLAVSGQMPHGYAVLYGMIAELYLSVVKVGCPKEPLQQLTQLMIHYYGRPQCKCSDREQLITLMEQDKKNERAAEINCTLIRTIGEPEINQVISRNEALEAFDYLFSL